MVPRRVAQYRLEPSRKREFRYYSGTTGDGATVGGFVFAAFCSTESLVPKWLEQVRTRMQPR